jgi:hypothetical protein
VDEELMIPNEIKLIITMGILILFCVLMIWASGRNGKKDKKKEPYITRRQKLKEYNRKERENK